MGLGGALTPTAQAQTPPASEQPQTPPASEQRCFPEDFEDYPPSGPAVAIIPTARLATADFEPGTPANILEVTGLDPLDFYCGRLFSTPIVLQVTQADASGRVTFKTATPKDFELNALHHLDVYRSAQLVGAFDFCVKKDGTIGSVKECKAAAGHGKLAKTGNDVWDIVRIALVLLALGVLAIYIRRRRSVATA